MPQSTAKYIKAQQSIVKYSKAMNESVKDIITYTATLLGGITIAVLFLIALYGILSGSFHEICKRIKRHNVDEDQ